MIFFGCCCSFLPVALIKQADQKQIREGKDFFGLHLQVPAHPWVESGQELKEEGTDRSPVEKLPAAQSGSGLTRFSYSGGPPAQGTGLLTGSSAPHTNQGSRKISGRQAHRPVWPRWSLSGETPFSGESTLCHKGNYDSICITFYVQIGRQSW